MFVSFFPRPKPFFLSLIAWIAVAVGLWYGVFRDLGVTLGIATPSDPDNPVIGPSYFITGEFLWFYIYFTVATLIFAAVWRVLSPQRWFWWSVLGSALILFITYFQVQVSVAVNNWYGPFYDLIQAALSKSRPVTADELYSSIASFTGIATVFIIVAVFTRFFVSHYIFRWRTAMNDYYLSHWDRLRTVEGAAQRVQEDTMRFASIVEDLGVSFVGSVMTLIAFLPVLLRLSKYVTELPVVGAVPEPLVVAAIGWSLFGTLFLALIGVKLPGLEFRNQRAEAAFRKELVFGEDDPNRARPPTLAELFGAVRRNYFRLYFHYMYFNVGRYLYLQADNIFSVFILIPTIAAGTITLGIFQQINNAFDQVRSSFQFLVLSWTTIVTLMSIYQRLRTFESMIEEGTVPSLEARYQARAD